MIPSLAKTFIEKLLEEVKKEHNMTKIQINVVNPLLQCCYSRLFPYFVISIFSLCLFLFVV